MDAFVAQSLSEQAVSEEPRAIAQSSAAQTGEAGMAASAEEPVPARKKARRKPSTAAVGEDAALEVLENLVLEESADAEDSQTPWADT
jgi:hypothetical protein